MGICENVQNLCKKKGLPVSHLEKELSLANGSIRRWNESSPATDKLQKVADYFKVPIDSLVFGFNRPLLSSTLTLVRNGRTFSQFVKDTGVDYDELFDICSSTSTKPPFLETIEKIAENNPIKHLISRYELLISAGYDPDESTAYPLLHSRIIEQREKEKITIEELSRVTGIDTAVIRIYELGERDNNPDHKILALLADYFDCTPDYLLGLANKSHRGTYASPFPNKEKVEFINTINQSITEIDRQETKKRQYNNFITDLSPKENRDIAHDLEKMLSDLESNNAMAFQGEPMDDDDKEMLRISLENSMRLAKQMAKKKFNPNKNKK